MEQTHIDSTSSLVTTEAVHEGWGIMLKGYQAAITCPVSSPVFCLMTFERVTVGPHPKSHHERIDGPQG
jgi:hypothetical protein